MIKDFWKLTNESYEFIKGEVIHLFVIHKIRCIPVSGFELATKMNITLIPYSGLSRKKLREAMYSSPDGVFVEKDGREYIYYNDIDFCYERQNWTILHEIGHIVLDHTGHGENEEEEANFFAKYAIAPPILVHEIGAKSPWDIHEKFDVSYEEAEYAYDYYCSWKRRFNRVKRFTEYEKKLLELYKKRA